MKYVNQINLALVVIAASAAVYAFTQTYFSPAPPPSFVTVPRSEAETNRQDAEVSLPDRPAAATATRPQAAEPVARPQAAPAAEPVPSRALPQTATPQPPAQAETVRRAPQRPAGQRPVAPIGIPGGGNAGASPQFTPPQLTPAGREAQKRGVDFGLSQPQQEGAEQPPPQPPRGPDPIRRDPNKRGTANPPPARSSMPEQRPR